MFREMWELHKIQISIFISKILMHTVPLGFSTTAVLGSCHSDRTARLATYRQFADSNGPMTAAATWKDVKLYTGEMRSAWETDVEF